MTHTQTAPTPDSKQKRFKGSLARNLLITLLVFTFVPFAVMASVGYLYARILLRQQATTQYQNLLTTQVKVIDNEVKDKETQLKNLLDSSDFKLLVELGLHANPKHATEFQKIRDSFLQAVNNLNAQAGAPAFSQILLIDINRNVKIASNPQWQSMVLDATILKQVSDEHPSLTLYGFPPLYKNQLFFITAYQYKTIRGSTLGTLIGITEGKNLVKMTQPINGLAPLAETYFVLANGQFVYNDPATGEFKVAPASTSQAALNAKLSSLMTANELQPVAMDALTSKNETALAQVQWFPAMQTGVVLEVRNNEIYGQITSLAPFTLGLILITLVAAAVVTLRINRAIRPLHVLSEITQKFAEGDWQKRAEVASNDEVGFLANSFNRMADQLSEAYRALEQKVDERTRQIQTTAEVAQSFSKLSDLDEMISKTVELLIQQFDFYQASVFLLERSGRYLEFKTGFGPATQGMKEKNYQLEVGSNSIMGWVSANNQPHVTSNVAEDDLHLKNDLLPETRSEATVPISMGNLVLGVLDVQSTQEGAFSVETVAMLQTLASQLATAIQTTGLSEISEIDFDELARLYRSSRLIAEASTEDEILRISSQILKEAQYVVVLLRVQNNGEGLEIFSSSDETKIGLPLEGLPQAIPAALEEIERYLAHGPIIATPKLRESPTALKDLAQQIGLESTAYIPIRKSGKLEAIMMMGIRQGILASAGLQPYTNLAELMTVALDRADAIRQTEKHLREVESLASINEAISRSSTLKDFFQALHKKIQQVLGDYSLIVALYEENTNTISVPFSYEDGQVAEIEAFPLGEGLTSILIRTLQPLLLVEDTEKKAAALGAKIVGKPARSWMGAPMMVQNKPIGALIIQDPDHEHAFNEDDLKFFTTITGQVAGVVHNVQLLEESQHKAVQLETAAEIARNISGSLNIDELLIKAVNLIRERFNFYHASVFLCDLPGEFAVIREATGEAGAQMKRAGYKIGIGSKSIVGFVSGRGEQLVVNDTTKDATYYANPLFPETRAEAAIPIKLSERILGVLDVQSSKPYTFSEDNLRSLQILADQIAVAVINTELFAETQEHLSQHRLLHHITTTVASGTTLDEALESAVNGLQVTLGGDRVIILLANREKKVLEVKASMGYSEDITKLQIPLGSGVIGWAAVHRKPLRINDVTTDPRYFEISSNTRSELAIPLVYRNELLGVLNVESEQLDAYTENDEEMLGTLGGSLAAIIANARLLEQIRLQAERERLIYEVSSKIRRSTDIQSIMMTTASELTRIVGAQYAKLQISPEKDKE